MARAPTDIRSLARSHTESCIRILASIAAKGSPDGARVAAIGILLDRGWGKAPQAVTGPDGEGAIRVVVRHILENGGLQEPRLVNGNKALDKPTEE